MGSILLLRYNFMIICRLCLSLSGRLFLSLNLNLSDLHG